jgi:hypothetical protein
MRAVDVKAGQALAVELSLTQMQRQSSAEEMRRAAAAEVAAQEQKERDQQMRSYEEARRRAELDRWHHSRTSQRVTGAILSVIGIALGGVGLGYLKAGSDGANRIKHGGLTLTEQTQYQASQNNDNIIAGAAGVPGGILCAIGLPIFIVGISKTKPPAATHTSETVQ